MNNYSNNWKRFIIWLGYNVLLALLPLFSVWLMRSLANKSTIEIVNDFPEILFFTLVVCATTISDIKTRRNLNFFGITFLMLEILLLIGIVISSVIYGAIRFANTTNPEFSIGLTPFYLISILIISLFVASLTTQLFVTYTDKIDTDDNKLEEVSNG